MNRYRMSAEFLGFSCLWGKFLYALEGRRKVSRDSPARGFCQFLIRVYPQHVVGVAPALTAESVGCLMEGSFP